MRRFPSLTAFAAPLFVLLWSTGFIGAKYGLPDAEPLTFLSLRYALVIVILATWTWGAGARWPTPRQALEAAVIGTLLHGVYLGGVFVAISLGTEAGLAALITGLQPVLTALAAWLILGDRLGGVQWAGMAAGFGGVALVTARKLSDGIGDWQGVALCLTSLAAISLASILQKRWASDHPMRGATVMQFLGALAVTLPVSLIFEQQRVEWTADFVFALGWLVLVLSVGAVSLLIVLIRRDAAANVASLFFLVPASTALIAWAMFGETMGPLELGGVALTALGVLMVNRPGMFRRA